jgi:toxin ParE1/3/4
VEVLFTPLAARHLDKLHEHLPKQSGEQRADGYVARIIAFCKGLARGPLRGARRDDILPGLRGTGFERRVTIALSVATQAVLIEGIYGGGRTYEAELRARR